MSDFEWLAQRLRDQDKRLDDADRRIASLVLIGRAEKVEGDKARVLFDDKDPVTGKPFKSPMLRWSNYSGAQGKGLAEYNPLTPGEIVAVISPSGELGPGSRIVPWGPTDQNKAPGEKPEDGKVITIGSARIAMKADSIEITVGGKGFTLTASEMKLSTLFRGKNGSRPAHYKTGKDSGGDAAVDGNDDVLI